jgi:CRISPR-associated protein Cas2
MRIRYLLCYDVRDDHRLRRTAKVAEAWGYRIQYSVFVCDLNDVERAKLEGRLKDVLDVSIDRAFLVDLGPAGHSSAPRLHWVSSPDRLYDPSEATIL